MRNISDRTTLADIVGLVSLYLYSVLVLFPDLTKFSLYLVIPIGFVFTFVSRPPKSTPLLVLFFCFWVWSAITAIMAEKVDVAIKQVITMAASLMFCSITSSLTQNWKLIPWLYGVYICMLISAFFVVHTNIEKFDYTNERFKDETLNSTTLGYLLLYGTCAIFYLYEILNGIWKKLIFVIFLGLIPLSFYYAIIGGSRQILIIQLPLIFSLLCFSLLKNRRARILLVCIVLISGGAYFGWGQKFYNKSFLKYRTEKNIQDDSRMLLVKESVQVGVDNPFFGVGPNNVMYHTTEGCFSHNSFLEAFANSGVLGLMLMIAIFVNLLKNIWTKYRVTRNNKFIMLLIFGIFFLIDNVFYVFYIVGAYWSFIFLLEGNANILYTNQKKQNIKRI